PARPYSPPRRSRTSAAASCPPPAAARCPTACAYPAARAASMSGRSAARTPPTRCACLLVVVPRLAPRPLFDRDGLGQVPWLVHVVPARGRHLRGERLVRDRGEPRLEQRGGRGDRDAVEIGRAHV